MLELYIKLVKNHLRTIESIPPEFQEKVRAAIEEKDGEEA